MSESELYVGVEVGGRVFEKIVVGHVQKTLAVAQVNGPTFGKTPFHAPHQAYIEGAHTLAQG